MLWGVGDDDDGLATRWIGGAPTSTRPPRTAPGPSGVKRSRSYRESTNFAFLGGGHMQEQEVELGDDEDEDFQEEEFLVTNLHGNVYSAAFLMTLRSLREGKTCSLLAAWFWIVVSTALNLFLLYVAWTYVTFKFERNFHEKYDGMENAEMRLQRAIFMNMTLDSEPDSMLVHLCYRLPSPYLFLGVEFMFSCFLMSTLSEIRGLMFQIWFSPLVRHRRHTLEELEQKTVVVGLMFTDYVLFTVGLIIPKLVFVGMLWYMGTALLAFTQEMTNMCYRAMMLVCISQADHMLYTSFLSTSKRDWVEKTQVAQLPRDCMRWGSAWPGEFVKLSGVVLSMIVSFMLFRSEFKVRSLCWTCAQQCDLLCSKAFNVCGQQRAHFWAWLHTIH